MRKSLIALVSLVFLAICPLMVAQKPLHNDDVIQLVKAGLSDDLLITTINASPGSYDTSPAGLIALKQANVSDKVVAAIVLKANGAAPTSGVSQPPADETSTAPPAPEAAPQPAPVPDTPPQPEPAPGPAAQPAPAPIPTPQPLVVLAPGALPPGIADVGVYLKDQNGDWALMLPETVTYESNGKLKNIASAGIMKGDLYGRVPGFRSRRRATPPVVLAVYLPEDASITDYQLLRLHAGADTREFLSAAGGVLHTTGNQTRDLVDFAPRKIAPRLYEIAFPAETVRGEFGLLVPGTSETSGKEQTGKIYTVSITE